MVHLGVVEVKRGRGTQEGTGAQGPFTIAPLHNAQIIYEGDVKHKLLFIVAHLQVKLCVCV